MTLCAHLPCYVYQLRDSQALVLSHGAVKSISGFSLQVNYVCSASCEGNLWGGKWYQLCSSVHELQKCSKVKWSHCASKKSNLKVLHIAYTSCFSNLLFVGCTQDVDKMPHPCHVPGMKSCHFGKSLSALSRHTSKNASVCEVTSLSRLVNYVACYSCSDCAHIVIDVFALEVH